MRTSLSVPVTPRCPRRRLGSCTIGFLSRLFQSSSVSMPKVAVVTFTIFPVVGNTGGCGAPGPPAAPLLPPATPFPAPPVLPATPPFPVAAPFPAAAAFPPPFTPCEAAPPELALPEPAPCPPVAGLPASGLADVLSALFPVILLVTLSFTLFRRLLN